jgi:hypothetical protein
MSDNPNWKLKTPDQLVIGDVIPVWGKDKVVQHAAPISLDDVSGIHVTFTDGNFSVYPHGVVVATVIQ